MPKVTKMHKFGALAIISSSLFLTGCANTGGGMLGAVVQTMGGDDCKPAGFVNVSDGEVSGNNNIEGAFNYFTSIGYSEEMAAGIVGNLEAESDGATPWLAEIGYESQWGWSVPGSQLRGWGIAQWTWERHDQVRNHVSNRIGSKYYTSQYSNPKAEDWLTEADESKLLKAQLEFLVKELEGSYRSTVYEPMKKASTPEEAADIFVRKFEVPANVDQTSLVRQASAKQFYDMYKGGGGSSKGDSDEEGPDVKPASNKSSSDMKVTTQSNKDSGNSDSKNASSLKWSFVMKEGAAMTSPYGPRTDPISGRSAFHTGADFVSSDPKKEVYAVTSGVITYAGFINNISGNLVVIKLDNGEFARYNHFSEIKVKQGDRVEAGDVVGIEGSTGYSTGSHLHFEIVPKDKADPNDPIGTQDFEGGTTDPVKWLESKGFTENGSPNGNTPSDQIINAGVSLNGDCGIFGNVGVDVSMGVGTSPGKDMKPGEIPEFDARAFKRADKVVTDNETDEVARINGYIREVWQSKGVKPDDVFDYPSGMDSCHGPGQALDVMVPVDSQLGDTVAAWLIKYKDQLGVSLVIWKQQIWIDQIADQGWRDMEDRGSITQNHRDHVHVSFKPCNR